MDGGPWRSVPDGAFEPISISDVPVDGLLLSKAKALLFNIGKMAREVMHKSNPTANDCANYFIEGFFFLNFMDGLGFYLSTVRNFQRVDRGG